MQVQLWSGPRFSLVCYCCSCFCCFGGAARWSGRESGPVLFFYLGSAVNPNSVWSSVMHPFISQERYFGLHLITRRLEGSKTESITQVGIKQEVVWVKQYHSILCKFCTVGVNMLPVWGYCVHWSKCLCSRHLPTPVAAVFRSHIDQSSTL